VGEKKLREAAKQAEGQSVHCRLIASRSLIARRRSLPNSDG